MCETWVFSNTWKKLAKINIYGPICRESIEEKYCVPRCQIILEFSNDSRAAIDQGICV